jgi:hypothetical protein
MYIFNELINQNKLMMQQIHGNWMYLKTSIGLKATTSTTRTSFPDKKPRHASSCRKSPPPSPLTVADSFSAPTRRSVKLERPPNSSPGWKL